MTPAVPSAVSERFCAADADVTIRSSDGVLFKVHRRNLECYTEGFPGEDIKTQNEVVHLAETSQTLELLFQYMYRQPQPDLSKIAFMTLYNLAEAVEKYGVYSAADICKVHMKLSIGSHAFPVLAYAIEHGYGELCDEVAPHCLGVAMKEVLEILPPDGFASWVIYHEQWSKVLLLCLTRTAPSGKHECSVWQEYHPHVLRRLALGPVALADLEALFQTKEVVLVGYTKCYGCQDRAEQWKIFVEATIKQHVLPFSIASRQSIGSHSRA